MHSGDWFGALWLDTARRIHLGSHLTLRRILVSPLARFRSCGRAKLALVSHATFFARASHPELEARAQIPDARGGMLHDVTSGVVGEADGTACQWSERHRISGAERSRGLDGRLAGARSL